MFDESGLAIMELAGKGYCCSQIMVLLALEEMDRENPDLARAAAGLCNGLGDCSGPCGVFTGASLVLGLHAGKGLDMEEADDRLPLMLEGLRDWFVAATEQYGGTSCGAILGRECGQPDKERCGGLLAGAFAQVRVILADNGFDPSEGREQG
jgi:hypothetical protein